MGPTDLIWAVVLLEEVVSLGSRECDFNVVVGNSYLISLAVATGEVGSNLSSHAYAIAHLYGFDLAADLDGSTHHLCIASVLVKYTCTAMKLSTNRVRHKWATGFLPIHLSCDNISAADPFGSSVRKLRYSRSTLCVHPSRRHHSTRWQCRYPGPQTASA